MLHYGTAPHVQYEAYWILNCSRKVRTASATLIGHSFALRVTFSRTVEAQCGRHYAGNMLCTRLYVGVQGKISPFVCTLVGEICKRRKLTLPVVTNFRYQHTRCAQPAQPATASTCMCSALTDCSSVDFDGSFLRVPFICLAVGFQIDSGACFQMYIFRSRFRFYFSNAKWRHLNAL
jgi:hypothetical protein